MGRLASQTAAHKLAHIMGLLVIPFVVLLTLYFLKSKGEIDAIAQKRAGIALAQWVIEAPKQMSSDQNLLLAQLENAAGLDPQQSFRSLQVKDISALRRYYESVGTSSQLLLDSERDVQSLANVVFELAPTYSQKLSLVTAEILKLQNVASGSSPQISIFLMSAGDLQSILSTMEAQLLAGPQDPTLKVTTSLSEFYLASRALDALSTHLTNPNSNPATRQQAFVALKQSSDQLSTNGMKSLQRSALRVIDVQLGVRMKSQWQSLLLLMIGGIASAVAGIGLAVLMLRSTFIRLDEVEAARNTADIARSEAETIALRFASINSDISRLNQEMATKVKELKAAQDELVKKGRMEQLGQLIATIAHEIRNPLGAIRTTAFMVERKIADKNLGLEGHLQRINNSVNRCDTIIAQLLDFSRTKEAHCDLIQLDDWLAKTIREEAERLPSNILIECALGLEAVKVSIDPSRMQRAIVNLLNNAAEAMAGQLDRLQPESPLRHHIMVSTKRVGDFAVIRIADNGPGIAAENIQKIREPLFTTKSFGTGLGIPAVEQVVIQHGGRLDISSDIGKGAVFSIHLPMKEQGALAA